MSELLIGFVSGIVSGSGMGGGTILILCLTIFLGTNQHIAQATNLIFFIPTSIAAIIINIKEKKINFKITWIIIIARNYRSNYRSCSSSKYRRNYVKKIIWNFFGNNCYP